MEISIYQINGERDDKRVKFANHDYTLKTAGEVAPNIYDKVFDGEVEAKTLEDVFRIFNVEHPENFAGHSLSVSDVVVVKKSETVKTGAYFCDSIGFCMLDSFDFDQCSPGFIKVLYFEPYKNARIAFIGRGLHSLQHAVGGYIEASGILGDAIIVCNEEGKYNGMEPCRVVFGEDNSTDIIFGPFFICNINDGNFSSLSDTLTEKYMNMYGQAEVITITENAVICRKVIV